MTNHTRMVWRILIVLLILICSIPIVSANKPNLEVAIIGGNQFQPGEIGLLNISVQNEEISPNSDAYAISAELKPRIAPIEVISDKAMIGPLKGGMISEVPLTFQIKVDEDAKPGKYDLGIDFDYEYTETSPAGISYLSGDEREYVTIEVVGSHFSVSDLRTKGLSVGSIGNVELKIKNSGEGDAYNVEAELIPKGDTLVPIDRTTFLGDLHSSQEEVAKFKVKAPETATSKIYPTNLLIKYEDEDGFPRTYTLEKTAFGIPVGKEMNFSIVKMEGKEMRAGSTATLKVRIRNDGREMARDVTAKLIPTKGIVPVGISSYLGDMNPNESKIAKFKFEISSDISPKNIPLNVLVKYEDVNENICKKRVNTTGFGVFVGKETEFEIIKTETGNELSPGSEGIVYVEIENQGDEIARDAIAKISIVDPFTGEDDTAYLGDIAPGATKVAKFKLSVVDDAVPKMYTVYTEVKYWDSENNSHVSKPMRAIIKVEPASYEKYWIPLLIIAIIIAAAIGGTLYLRRK